MDLSGIIFVVLAVAWAVYLIPKALKHHDELAHSRPIDRFSTSMRVLAHREPVGRREARLVVTPPRPAASSRVPVPMAPDEAATAPDEAATAPDEAATAPDETATALSAPGVEDVTARRPAGTGSRRESARTAARRRRRILLLLLLAVAVVTALAGLARVPWWAVSIPGGLTLVWLLLCRRQVRRQRAAGRPRGRAESAYGTSAVVDGAAADRAGLEELSPDEDTVGMSSAAVAAAMSAGSAEEADAAASRVLAAEAAPNGVPATDGASLWDPLPVTLPTYVTKPRAERAVRTIDLGQPGAWTSGRSQADSRLVEEAAAHEEAVAGTEPRRAVGS